MKALLQRIKYARVKVGEEITGEIGRGILVLLGVAVGEGGEAKKRQRDDGQNFH